MKSAKNIPSGSRANLRLLATTDLHMHLTGFDFYSDRVDHSTGLTRTATLIKAARKTAAQDDALTLLFDNGDSLQGTPFGDMAILETDQEHPLMRAFGHLHYDAIGLGNHDFNFGLDPLLAVLAQAPCPVVCSNLHANNGQDLTGIAPFAVLDRVVHSGGQTLPLRIGVLSFLPPQTVHWDAHLLQGRITVDDIPSAARRCLKLLQPLACDVIVALAHSGLDDRPMREGMENAVLPLAAIDGIDAIIAGHTHLHLPGEDHSGMSQVDICAGSVHGKPTVMPGSAGSHLGVIDLQLKAEQTNQWQVDRFKCALQPIKSHCADKQQNQPVEEDPALMACLTEGQSKTRASINQVIGTWDHALHSYFSLFATDRALAVVAAVQAAALRPLLANTPADDYPLLSAASPSKFGGRAGPNSFTDIPAGDISLRHVFDLYMFPDELRAIILTGDQILQWLNQSASLFHQITPGTSGSTLTDKDVPGHNFDVLHGLTWQIDLSAAPASGPISQPTRVCDVRYHRELIQPTQRFVVALNNYRANGGGEFDILKQAEPLPIPCLQIRDLVRDYLSGTLGPDPLGAAACDWRFKPMPGTDVCVQTGLGATAYLDEISDRNIEISRQTQDDFLHLTLHL